MSDNANKPGEEKSDAVQRRTDKASENLSNGTPEVNHRNLRSALKTNPNRTDTVSPDGKSRFCLTDDRKPAENQGKAVQEKAYIDAGLGDPHKPIGKSSELGIDHQKITEQAAKALGKIIDSGKSELNEGAKLWQGAHNGMHELIDESVKSAGVAKDYYGNALSGKVNVTSDIKDFTDAVSKGVSQSLGTASDYYFRQVSKGEANLGRDIATASKAAADHWNTMDSEQKGHFIGKEVVPLLVPGAIGVVAKEVQGANLIAKTGQAITAFSSSEKMAEIEQKMALLQGHIQKMTELAKPLESAYATVTERPGRRSSLPEVPKKGDNYLAMSKSEEGENLPRKPREGPERERGPEKIPVSESFVAELKDVIGRLSDGEKKFLQEHHIEIEPIRRMEDKFPRRRDLAACYDVTENKIYVPEEVPRLGKYVPNYDIEFAFRHEFGHAYNLKFDSLGQYISETPEFRAAFRQDIKAIPAEKLEKLRLEYPTIEEKRDEVFSDMYAHATGLQSNNPRSMQMKDLFPNCLEFAKTRRI